MIFNVFNSISKIFHFENKETEYFDENIGRKAKLIRDYPLRVASLTKGNEYEILNTSRVRKVVTTRVDMDIEFWQIENDDKEKIWVSICYFEL